MINLAIPKGILNISKYTKEIYVPLNITEDINNGKFAMKFIFDKNKDKNFIADMSTLKTTETDYTYETVAFLNLSKYDILTFLNNGPANLEIRINPAIEVYLQGDPELKDINPITQNLKIKGNIKNIRNNSFNGNFQYLKNLLIQNCNGIDVNGFSNCSLDNVKFEADRNNKEIFIMNQICPNATFDLTDYQKIVFDIPFFSKTFNKISEDRLKQLLATSNIKLGSMFYTNLLDGLFLSPTYLINKKCTIMGEAVSHDTNSVNEIEFKNKGQKNKEENININIKQIFKYLTQKKLVAGTSQEQEIILEINKLIDESDQLNIVAYKSLPYGDTFQKKVKTLFDK